MLTRKRDVYPTWVSPVGWEFDISAQPLPRVLEKVQLFAEEMNSRMVRATSLLFSLKFYLKIPNFPINFFFLRVGKMVQRPIAFATQAWSSIGNPALTLKKQAWPHVPETSELWGIWTRGSLGFTRYQAPSSVWDSVSRV